MIKFYVLAVVSALCLGACGPDYTYPDGPYRTEPEAKVHRHLYYGNWEPGQADGGTVIDAGQDTDTDDDQDGGTSTDAGTKCKPGNGWGDKNHCHTGSGGK